MMKIKICYKSNVSVKVLRAKLTGTWEGGGIKGKKHKRKEFLDKGVHFYHFPLGIGLTSKLK